MERKTMGTFIAVLRKSKGYTQKELGEMLGVSDKTVSHWERDESAPDLSVLPIIADIFSVTCDELIRGQKSCNNDEEKDKALLQKRNKQLKYLFEKRLTKFKIQTILCILFFVIGVIISYILDYYIVTPIFFVQLIFTLTSVTLLTVFYTLCTHSISSDELEEAFVEASQNKCKLIFSLSLFAIAAAQSLLIVFYYYGSSSSFFIFIVILFLGFTAFIIAINFKAVKELKIFKNSSKRTWINRLISLLLCLMLIVMGTSTLTNIRSYIYINQHYYTTFSNTDEFIKYMETEKSFPEKYTNNISITLSSTTVFDNDGNSVVTDTFFDENGENIIQSFVWKNHEVSDYTVDENQRIITVTTYESQYKLKMLYQAFNIATYVYLALTLLAFVLWNIRLSKRSQNSK